VEEETDRAKRKRNVSYPSLFDLGALLILARNERGLAVHEQVDLATVAEDVLDTVPLDDRRVHASLEPAVISGDPVLVEHLIANLVDNSVRYNAAGGHIWVSTRRTAGCSQLTVANTGPVISAADADRVFQPFQRLNDRTSHEGFGLGLTIVASIAAIHAGTATADPRNDGGLSVTVTIPSAAATTQGTKQTSPRLYRQQIMEPEKEQLTPLDGARTISAVAANGIATIVSASDYVSTFLSATRDEDAAMAPSPAPFYRRSFTGP